MSLPTISFEATLIEAPELKFTGQGLAVATIRVAVNERKKDESGKYVNGDATYLRLNVWRLQAENCAESLHKGDTVVVVGKYRSRSYEAHDGSKKYTQEVDVDSIGLSLRWESFDSAKGVKQTAAKDTSADPWAANAPF